ncbi:fused MFS/spermidine synthase [bacterium]|nr:fused MFS/spermidine synthase [bacterium]
MIVTPEELAIHKPQKELLKIINNKTFDDKILYQKESDFHSISVVENEVGRFLHYKDTYQAGVINTDFYRGNIPYINYFLIPYLFNPSVEKILLIGMGTGIIVNQYEKLFTSLKKIDVVDIESNILEIAENFFEFKASDKLNFVLQDGIVYLNNTKQKYDLIVVDVASNEGIDLRFCTNEYLSLIKSHLKKGGIFVSNMPSSADVFNPQNTFILNLLSIYRQTFKNVNLYKGDESDRIYYKAFFNLDERVIDITNLIFISSDCSMSIKENIASIEKLGVSIQNYINNLIV